MFLCVFDCTLATLAGNTFKYLSQHFFSPYILAQQAYFSSKPPPGIMKATIGQDFTFNWSLILEKNDSLVFMSLEYSKTEQFTETSTENIAYILQDSPPIVNNDFKGKVSVSRTGSLTLHNVSVEQRGFYKCSVSLQQKTRAVSIKRQLLVGGNYARIVVTSL